MRYIQIAGQNVPVSFSASAGRLIYRLSTTNPEMQLPVRLRIELLTRRRPWRVAVSVRGVPECQRHRYADDSPCLWWRAIPTPAGGCRRWPAGARAIRADPSLPGSVLQGGPAVAWGGGSRKAPASPALRDLSGDRAVNARKVVRDYGPLLGPLLGLAGVALTLWFNARRAERDRRRHMHARAIGTVAAYIEMPYVDSSAPPRTRTRQRRTRAADRRLAGNPGRPDMRRVPHAH